MAMHVTAVWPMRHQTVHPSSPAIGRVASRGYYMTDYATGSIT
jgi:hypothetical protein